MGLFLPQNCYSPLEPQKAAPDTTQQASGSEGDILTPSPASSLTAGAALAGEVGAEVFHGERCLSAACHPTQLKPSDWSFQDADPGPTSSRERSGDTRIVGATLVVA